MRKEKVGNYRNNFEQAKISLMFPKNREEYIQKLFGIFLLMLFLWWLIIFKIEQDNIFLFSMAILMGVLSVFVLLEKILFLLKVDKIVATSESLQLYYQNRITQAYHFEKIGLKMVSDISDKFEISFYDLSKKKKIFHCKENEVEQSELQTLLEHLEKVTTIDTNIIKYGTYGEVVPLVLGSSDSSKSIDMTRYYSKDYFYTTR